MDKIGQSPTNISNTAAKETMTNSHTPGDNYNNIYLRVFFGKDYNKLGTNLGDNILCPKVIINHLQYQHKTGQYPVTEQSVNTL